MAKRSVVIYLPDFQSGGAERVQLHLSPIFVEHGFDVTFLVHRAQGALLPLVPQHIRIISLQCGRTMGALLPLIRFLRREKPDILLSNLAHNNMLAIAAARIADARTQVIASYHGALSQEAKVGWKNRILLPLSKLTLKHAEAVVAVSQGAANDLASITGMPRERFTVIYNPVVSADFALRTHEALAHPWLDGSVPFIISAGRLVELKDFATLLRAFALLTKTLPARLMILGEGPLHNNLLVQAQALGIEEHVCLPGFIANPLPYLNAASLVVSSSRYEGFGNVLVEALACGTPVVSTNCPFGPAEILENGKYGALVPVGDAQAMAQAMIETLRNPLPTESLRQRGNYFTVERAADAYIDLFNRLA